MGNFLQSSVCLLARTWHPPPPMGLLDQKPIHAVLTISKLHGHSLGTKCLVVTLDRWLQFKASTKLVHGKALRTHVRLYSLFRTAQLCPKAELALAKPLIRSLLPSALAGSSKLRH
jgi:hypothetical protein